MAFRIRGEPAPDQYWLEGSASFVAGASSSFQFTEAPATVINLNPQGYSIFDNQSSSLQVTRDGSLFGVVEVDWLITGPNASDFSQTFGTVQFTDSQATANIPVTVADLTANGSAQVDISNATNGASIGTSQAAITITDTPGQTITTEDFENAVPGLYINGAIITGTSRPLRVTAYNGYDANVIDGIGRGGGKAVRLNYNRTKTTSSVDVNNAVYIRSNEESWSSDFAITWWMKRVEWTGGGYDWVSPQNKLCYVYWGGSGGPTLSSTVTLWFFNLANTIAAQSGQSSDIKLYSHVLGANDEILGYKTIQTSAYNSFWNTWNKFTYRWKSPTGIVSGSQTTADGKFEFSINDIVIQSKYDMQFDGPRTSGSVANAKMYSFRIGQQINMTASETSNPSGYYAEHRDIDDVIISTPSGL